MPAKALRLSLLALSSIPLLLAGCGTGTTVSTFVAPAVAHGMVHGGQQPVAGATIQLYAVGTGGDGSAAAPLLSPAPLSGAGGDFNITGTYTCPTPSSLVYLVATGGNPGLGAGGKNPQLALMAALGPCSGLSASTVLLVDELTTVAAVSQMAPFMTSPSAVGASSTDMTYLSSAMTTAMEMVNNATGTAPGVNVPAGTTIPVAQINTLGDILAGCINSAGGVAGDASSCGSLFTLTTPTGAVAPTDTITAMLNIANNPSANTAALLALALPTSPFQPTLTQPPAFFAPAPVPPSNGTGTSSMNLGSVVVGYPAASQTVVITNTDLNDTTFTAQISGVDPADFSVSPSGCTALPWKAICPLSVQFTPKALGARTALLTVSNSSVGVFSATLLGQGLPPTAGPASLSASSLVIPDVQTAQTLTLTNNGPLSLLIHSITVDSAFFVYHNCGTNLAAGASCTIAVSAYGGKSTGTLTVTDNDTNGPLTASLSYTGSVAYQGTTYPRGLAAFPNFMTWSLGTSSTLTFYVYQPAPVYYAASTLSGSPDFKIVNNCVGTTNGDVWSTYRYCGIIVQFTPSGLGLRQASLTGPLGGADFSGYGVAPGPGLALTLDSSYYVANGNDCEQSCTGAEQTMNPVTATLFKPPLIVGTPVNSNAEECSNGFGCNGALNGLNFLLTNTGTTTLALKAPVITGPDAASFSTAGPCPATGYTTASCLSPSCPATLAPGTSCYFYVIANAKHSGNLTATAVFSDTAGTVQRTLVLLATAQ